MTPMHPGHQAAAGDGGTTITTVWHLAGVPNATAQLISFLGALAFLGFLTIILWIDYCRISRELDRYRSGK